MPSFSTDSTKEYLYFIQIFGYFKHNVYFDNMVLSKKDANDQESKSDILQSSNLMKLIPLIPKMRF